ncbi:MAG: UDP-4-amino-4,6-dideoxy-N-acetyl-beta-L-altrosamine N-acetyltransferase [Campylobacterales bacterium]|nr:UDP-4-amino-4,6-dideoxy-N-acetyl-beta-L-altrosamine N-acetyltransferase [Campylobacterales bacterium]
MGDFQLINFVDLELSLHQLILTWRNNKEISKWMYSQDKILINDHLSFVKTLKESQTKKYFLVKQAEKYIGVIDFTNMDMEKRTCDFGLYTNPELKGFGKDLMSLICKYSFEELGLRKIFAEAFFDNEKAIKLYESFNFKKVSTENKNGQEIVRLELKHENR